MASLAVQRPLQEILDMPEGTKGQIKAKVEEHLKKVIYLEIKADHLEADMIPD